MKKKKKMESMERFVKRRNKETGVVTIPETKPSPTDSGGSHKSLARQMHIGVVKKKTAMKLERIVKKKKRKNLES